MDFTQSATWEVTTSDDRIVLLGEIGDPRDEGVLWSRRCKSTVPTQEGENPAVGGVDEVHTAREDFNTSAFNFETVVHLSQVVQN